MPKFVAEDAQDIPKMLSFTEPGPDGCKLWEGPFCNSGHPVLHLNNTMIRLSRQVYIAHYGRIPKHWQVEAWCKQRRCINPEHLRACLKATACKPIVGVPLPKGESLKSAGYQLVHRKLGVSVWEPADIALAINQTLLATDCEGCGKPLAKPGKKFCDKECTRRAHMARRKVSATTMSV